MKATIIFFIAGILLSCGCVSEDNGEDLTIAGSTTVQPIVTKAAEVYGQEHPDVKIGVQGGGSGTGIRMVGEGSVAVGASSRDISPGEKASYLDLETTAIALDSIVIVVHPSNNISDLSIPQIRDIFSGKITNYKEIGGPDRPIVLVIREDGSGTRSNFDELVMNKTDTSDSALQKSESGAVRFTVSGNRNAIGYVGLGFLDGSIKPLLVNGILSSEETVRSEEYPFARKLYLITKGEPEGLSKKFIDFILSDEGQNIVREEGFVRIK